MLNVRQRVIASWVWMLSVIVLSSHAAGQSGIPAPRWMDRESAPSALVWPRAVEIQGRPITADARMGRAQPMPRGSSRDTLKNGVLIGAVAGAVALGAFGAFFCNLYQEGQSCWPDTLRLAAIGAAIGTGAGLAVDAALIRHAGVAVRVGINF